MKKKSEEIRYSPKALNEQWAKDNRIEVKSSKEKKTNKEKKPKINIVEYYD